MSSNWWQLRIRMVAIVLISLVLGGCNCVSVAPSIESFEPGLGQPGTRVTVAGTGLGWWCYMPVGAQPEVDFGGVNAEEVMVYGEMVTARVPPAAQSGPIRIVTGMGEDSSDANFVVVSCSAPPVVGNVMKLGCEHGIMLSCDKPPTGQFDQFEVVEKLSTAHDNLVFFFGDWELGGLVRNVREKGDTDGMRLGDYYVVSAEKHGVQSLAGDCDESNGGYPLRACLVPDGVFFEIDGNRDGEYDDMMVKMSPYGTCTITGD